MRKHIKIGTVIIYAVFICVIASILVACSTPRATESAIDNFEIGGVNLICIGEVEYFGVCHTVFYDRDTKVMYWYEHRGYSGGITPLYNADGTLKLYEENTDGEE